MIDKKRAFDLLNLFLSAIGSTYAAIVPAYLTTQHWSQTQIGLVLTIATVSGLLTQIPAALLADRIRDNWRLAMTAALAISGLVPLVLAIYPRALPVMVAAGIGSMVGALFGPLIAIASIVLSGRDNLGERLGRNGRYGSIGAGLGAALMGASGYFGSQRVAFFIAAAMTIPAILAVRAVGRIENTMSAPSSDGSQTKEMFLAPFRLLRDRRLLIYATCVALFQVASIAVLQLAAVDVTKRLGMRGSLVIAAFIIVPQVVVAIVSPWIGRMAERWGRRLVLIVGFATVPLRGFLFAALGNPYMLIPVQVLEGAGGAAFGVMMPLIAADLTKGRNYTLCLALLGLAGGAGTAISTALAGWTTDHFGRGAAYWLLFAAGVLAVALVAAAMPETKSEQSRRQDAG